MKFGSRKLNELLFSFGNNRKDNEGRCMARWFKLIMDYPYWPKFRGNLLRNHTDCYDKCVLMVSLLTLVVAALIEVLNYFFWHYKQFNVAIDAVVMIPLFMSLGFCSVALSDRFPRMSLVGFSLFLSYWVARLQLIIIGAAIDTPFPLVDHWLLQVDVFLHLNTVALLIWVHQHTVFHQILSFAYDSWTYQLIIFPLVFAFFKEKHVLMRYYCGIVILFFSGVIIYFFFPANGPASVLHSPLFTYSDTLVAPVFAAVHSGRPIPHVYIGIITVPSFHVLGSLWLCFMISCFVKRKIFAVGSTYAVAVIVLLWAMALLWNALLIASTIMLGEHYIVDVVVSVVMVVVVYAATSPHYKKLCAVSGN